MNSTINFIYFLYNHRGLSTGLTQCFGEHLGNHFIGKLKSGSPADIITLIVEMTDDNKELFLNWIENNYTYKRS